MPGFSIYAGRLIPESALIEQLEQYRNVQLVNGDGTRTQMIEEIKDLIQRDDGTLQFTYSFDQREPYNEHGLTRFVTKTYDLEIRVLRQQMLIYLVSKVRGVKMSEILQKISYLIYGNAKTIFKAGISSDAIVFTEQRDYRKISAEGFLNVTDRDSMLVGYGNLAVRQDTGEEEFSDFHSTYGGEKKGYTRYKSITTDYEVFISAKQSSLTLRGEHATLDEVERYISVHLIPQLNFNS